MDGKVSDDCFFHFDTPGQSTGAIGLRVERKRFRRLFFHFDTPGQCRGDRSAGWTEKFPPIIFSIMTPLANLPGRSVCGLDGKVAADYFFHFDTPGQSTGAIGLRVGRKSFRRLFFHFDTPGQCRDDRSAGWTEKFPPIIFSILTPLANLPGRSVCGLDAKVSADYFFHFDIPGQCRGDRSVGWTEKFPPNIFSILTPLANAGTIGLRVGRKSFRRLFFQF